MKNTNDYTFEVSISTQNFDHKPNRKNEVSKLRFHKITTDVYGFANAIAEGYCYTPVFTNPTFGMSEKTDNNYRYSSIISIDIDHAEAEMNTMVANLPYKPTIAYTSCSNGKDGEYSYRLIYAFDNIIEGKEEYSNYVHTILNANDISIDEIDKRSLKASQYYNGNGCGNINIQVSDIVYSKEDFIDYYIDNSSNEDGGITKSANQNHNTTHTSIMSFNDTFEDKQFEDDFKNMRMEDVLSKYIDVFPNMEHTPLPVVSDDTPYILFPDDYTEIRRYWTCKDDGRAIKIKDGEGRRRKLFLNGIIRRLINPDITFDNLVYNLLFELVFYISNFDAENIIDKKEIINIARNVMKEDLTKYECLKGSDRKFIVNPKYCVKYGLNKKQVKNIASKMIRNNGIGELYDCNLTDKENLEGMKENGKVISLRTLKRWREESGITKYKKGKPS